METEEPPTEEVPRPRRNRRVTVVLLGLTALGALAFVGALALIVVAVNYEDSGEVTEGSFLSLKLSGGVSEGPSQGQFLVDPSSFPPTVSEITMALRQAANDDRIDGLYLRLGAQSLGWAVTQEIRQALEVFQASEKPCVVYAEGVQTTSYYLASVCSTLVLAPSGTNLVSGLNVERTYYAGMFDKLHIEAEFEHVGDFKSAVEPYERTGPSDSAALAMNELLDVLYEDFLTQTAKGRSMEKSELQALVDRPPMFAPDAVEAGLVDAVAFEDQVRMHLGQATDENFLELLSNDDEPSKVKLTKFIEYVKELRVERSKTEAQVAVVIAEGPIVSGKADGGLFGDAVLADQVFKGWLKEVRDNDDIKAVVLRVNSPGGSGLASDSMWRQVELTKATGKPVVVTMGNLAASGGYFLSAGADYIFAQPGTLTGSIGVLGGKLDVSGTYGLLGMSHHRYKRGELADLFSGTASVSDEGREVFKHYLTSFYEEFVGKVATGREMERDAVHEVAQGRVWSGQQALDNGLVDELGGLDAALAKAAELAEIEDYGILFLPKHKDFFELLMEDLKDARQPEVRVDVLDWVEPLASPQELSELFLLQRMLSDGGIATYLGGHPTIY